jgi:hypothetical protein
MVVVHRGMRLYGSPMSKLGYRSIPITAGCAEAMAAHIERFGLPR